MNRLSNAPRKPWNGVWTVPKPADYVDGLYRLHQVIAHGFLRSGQPLDEWECSFLQRLARQPGDLNNLQTYWLGRIEQDVIGRTGA